MALISKNVDTKLNGQNIKYYEKLGYEIPRKKDKNGIMRVPLGTKINVKVEDLQSGSKEEVVVQCDECNKILKNVKWYSYKKNIKDQNKYYCQSCGNKLFGVKKRINNNLKSSISFEKWCVDNNKKDILNQWDFKLNKCSPSDISYGTRNKYWFKCPRDLHNSELKSIGDFTSGHNGVMNCKACSSFGQWCIDNFSKEKAENIISRWDYKKNNCTPFEVRYNSISNNHKGYYFKCPIGLHESELKLINRFVEGHDGSIDCKVCNSFAQWGIDNLGEDFLEKYWDYEKNSTNPWMIAKGGNQEIYIRCQKTSYHGSYKITCGNFINGGRCAFCSKQKIHYLDSLGNLCKKAISLWSDKNEKTPYEYSFNSNQKVYWKCPEGKHEDYLRSIYNSNKICNFRCPECQFSKGELIISDLLNRSRISYIPQKEFDNLIGLGGGNLSYDFYLFQNNLLIEYQGEQHEKYIKGFHKSKKDFEKQQEHDKRKREYAKEHNIKLLEIWYWDFDNIEKILAKELNSNNKENNQLKPCS